jgi:hypothetical protein
MWIVMPAKTHDGKVVRHMNISVIDAPKALYHRRQLARHIRRADGAKKLMLRHTRLVLVVSHSKCQRTPHELPLAAGQVTAKSRKSLKRKGTN